MAVSRLYSLLACNCYVTQRTHKKLTSVAVRRLHAARWQVVAVDSSVCSTGGAKWLRVAVICCYAMKRIRWRIRPPCIRRLKKNNFRTPFSVVSTLPSVPLWPSSGVATFNACEMWKDEFLRIVKKLVTDWYSPTSAGYEFQTDGAIAM